MIPEWFQMILRHLLTKNFDADNYSQNISSKNYSFFKNPENSFKTNIHFFNIQKIHSNKIFIFFKKCWRKFKKFISSIYHDSKISNKILFETSFSYLKAFPPPSTGCSRMTNQLFSKCYQGVLPSKKCHRRVALGYVIYKALLWPE